MRKNKFIALLAMLFMVLAIMAPTMAVQAHEDGTACAGGSSDGGRGGSAHMGGERGGPGGAGDDHDGGSCGGDDGSETHSPGSTSGHKGSGYSGPVGSSGGHDSGEGNSSDSDNSGEIDEGESGSGRSDKGNIAKGAGGSGGPPGDVGKGGPGRDVAGGTITLVVTVEGLDDSGFLPVNITLEREGIPNTVTTVDVDGAPTATFTSEAGGDCFLYGEDVPGYITPQKPIALTGNEKLTYATLEYEPGEIGVEGIEISKSQTQIIKGYTEKLDARVLPYNAGDQRIRWSSEDETVAMVDDYGWVTAKSSGTANIIASAYNDADITAHCEVTVVAIDYLVDPEPVTVLRNQVLILPPGVTAVLEDETAEILPVAWSAPDGGNVTVFQVPEDCPVGPITLTGSVVGTDEIATLVIDVSHGLAVGVSGVALDINEISLVVGADYQLTASVTPVGATTKEVIWSSDNEGVVTVENGLVTGVAPGMATVTAETVDGGYRAYCTVSVYNAPELELIFPTIQGLDVPFTEFNDREEVYINVAELVKQTEFSDDEGIPYYVKVEQKGNDRLLGEGIVTITPTTVEFNLYQVTEYLITNKYSNEYFMYMSTDPNYPKDDEQTLMTNFKIGSAVPTVPEENVEVTLEIIGGPRDNQPGGIFFLLCRELDEDAYDTTWDDYLLNPGHALDLYSNNPRIDVNSLKQYFSDEVKMYGETDENGAVQWVKPKETLKLGGYLLLEVTPRGYSDNLNSINPYAHDPELLKEVHLTRNGGIERYITNIYTGIGAGPQ